MLVACDSTGSAQSCVIPTAHPQADLRVLLQPLLKIIKHGCLLLASSQFTHSLHITKREECAFWGMSFPLDDVYSS